MNTGPQTFNGDRPITGKAGDRLGFTPAAQHVARSINDLASPAGFVVGVEGEWGAGKTSFIGLVIEALGEAKSPPEIIQFMPWVISSRPALLRELFSEIAAAAGRIAVDDAAIEVSKNWWARQTEKMLPSRYSAQEARRKKIVGLFDRFSNRLSAIGKLADLADAFGIAGAKSISTGLSAGQGAASRLLSENSLKRDKGSLQTELARLNRKIVVFVDDLDRLEPTEALEVLRLVRAVADFPNIVYVLCYSRTIVAENLETALGVSAGKGSAFIEKIVQGTFAIPKPEAFDLRRMFRQELLEMYPDILVGDEPSKRAVKDRLAIVIDVEGGRTLQTPRHIARVLNSLRFYATPVLQKIDLADMVWLQLIRGRCPELYDWIEAYMNGVGAIANGGRISETGKKGQAKSLVEMFESADFDDGWPLDDRWRHFGEYLPGVNQRTAAQGDDQWLVYDQVSEQELASRIAERRLGSPQHYRYYFALSPPTGAIEDSDFEEFLKNSEEAPEAASRQFLIYSNTPRAQGGVVAEAVLDRLKGSAVHRLSDAAARGVLLAIGDGMDDAARQIGRGDWGEYWIWRDAQRILAESLSDKAADFRLGLVSDLFEGARSLGWLTNVFRGETFDHGIYGDRKAPEDQWMLTSEEFDLARDRIVERYRKLGGADIRRIPKFSNVFYAWVQAVPEAITEIREKFAQLSVNDQDFIELMNVMRSWRSSNGFVHHPLKRKEFDWLVDDFDQIGNRLKKLAASSDNNVIRLRAGDLVEALTQGEEDLL